MKLLTQTEFRGLFSRRSAEEIPLGFAARVKNSDHASSSSVEPHKAYETYGNQDNATDKGKRKFTYSRGDGFETKVHVRDDGSNTILEYHNPSDTRKHAKGEWLVLVSGLTKDTVMGFTPFNDTGTDNMIFCNGIENFSVWSGAICVFDGAVLAAASTITVKKVTGDPKTNPTDGFPSSGTIVYRDTAGAIKSLAYSSKTATVFTMTTPGNTTASADLTGCAEAADTSTHSALNKNNILHTAQGRVWATGNPAQPTVLDFSEVSDFTNFTAAANPDDPGARDFPEGGNNTAIKSRDAWIFLGKDKGVFAYQIVYQSATTRSEVVKKISNIGIATQMSIKQIGNDYVYISPDGNIMQLSRIEAENEFNVQDLSELIEPTIRDMVFDEASMVYWKKRRRLLIAAKKNSESSKNDQVIELQLSNNEEGAKVINYGILDWYVGDWSVWEENLYHISSVESYDFKSFAGYDKNTAPYEWIRTDRIENFGKPSEQKQLFFHEIAGFMSTGTTLTTIYAFDENGITVELEKSLAGTQGEPIVVAQPLNTIGAFELGSDPIGGTSENLEDLDFFHVFFELPPDYRPYNVQRSFKLDGVGQRVVILRDTWHYDFSDDDINSQLIL